MPDSEAVKLLISFYKLHFLGTKFSKKMLKIDLNEDPSKYQQAMEADDDLANVSDDQLVADTSGADDTEDG